MYVSTHRATSYYVHKSLMLSMSEIKDPQGVIHTCIGIQKNFHQFLPDKNVFAPHPLLGGGFEQQSSFDSAVEVLMRSQVLFKHILS
jgi:hypothetical protein